MKINKEKIAQTIKKNCPEVVFAFLYGSTARNELTKSSDLDIAVYLDPKNTTDFYKKIYELLESLSNNRDLDIGILNNSDPVYRFEALKGQLLICRDINKFADFFSSTCREYEYQTADYQRQKKYRKELSTSN